MEANPCLSPWQFIFLNKSEEDSGFPYGVGIRAYNPHYARRINRVLGFEIVYLQSVKQVGKKVLLKWTTLIRSDANVTLHKGVRLL